MSSILTYMDPKQLQAAQQLALYSFEIPQDPVKVRSCYNVNAVIVTNGTEQTLDQFIAYLIESNAKNVVKIYTLSNSYRALEEKEGIAWKVEVEQLRLGKGMDEPSEGMYKITQLAYLTFSGDKVISQVNILRKTKI